MNANKNLDDIIHSLNNSIKNTVEYKEYCSNKKILENNEKLRALNENLNNMKHLMCLCNDDALKEEYSRAREEYEASPLVVNYKISESKLNTLIIDIISDINEGL